MVGVSTFAFATETTIEELKNCSKTKILRKALARNRKLYAAELNTLLKHFYAEVNNKKVKIMNQKALK